jgi:ribosome biogenesis protein ENP2
MMYHAPSCDLLVCGASNEVFRLNLDQGRFLNPLQTSMQAINVCDLSPAHQLWGFGGEDGVAEFWHPTSRAKIGSLDIAAAVAQALPAGSLEAAPEISALKFAEDGLTFAVGTSTGQVLLYDLRQQTPLIVKDHQYGYPIKALHFHASGNVLSADTKIIKIWNKDSVRVYRDNYQSK